jgi:hypothetical protein
LSILSEFCLKYHHFRHIFTPKIKKITQKSFFDPLCGIAVTLCGIAVEALCGIAVDLCGIAVEILNVTGKIIFPPTVG